jgi:hypothetical protein
MVKQVPRKLFSPTLVAGLVVTICAGTAGVAAAYWSGSGAGAGAAATATSRRLSVGPGVPTTFLSPGAQSAVVLTMSNPNPTAVSVTTLELDTAEGTGGFAVDAGHPGCAVSALSFSTQTNAGAGWTVPMKSGGTDGTLSLTLVNAIAMAADAANACQGAVFTVYVRARS